MGINKKARKARFNKKVKALKPKVNGYNITKSVFFPLNYFLNTKHPFYNWCLKKYYRNMQALTCVDLNTILSFLIYQPNALIAGVLPFVIMFLQILEYSPWHSLEFPTETSKKKVMSSTDASPIEFINRLEKEIFEKRISILIDNYSFTSPLHQLLFMEECAAWIALNYKTYGCKSWYYFQRFKQVLNADIARLLHTKLIFSPQNFIDYKDGALFDVDDTSELFGISFDEAIVLIYKMLHANRYHFNRKVDNVPAQYYLELVAYNNKVDEPLDLSYIFVPTMYLMQGFYTFGLLYVNKPNKLFNISFKTEVMAGYAVPQKDLLYYLWRGMSEHYAGLVILYNLYFKNIEPEAGVYTSIYVFYLDVGLQNLVSPSSKLYKTGFDKIKNSPGFEQFCLIKNLDPKNPPIAYRQITSYSVPFSTPNFLDAINSQLRIAFNQRGYD